MTGYRRAYGRSRIPRRYVPLSEKSILLGAVQEEGLSRGEVARGDFFGIKDESEIVVVGTMVCCSTASEEPVGTAT